MEDETLMNTLICPACARMSRLQKFDRPERKVPRRDTVVGTYTCEGGHAITVTVEPAPTLPGDAA